MLVCTSRNKRSSVFAMCVGNADAGNQNLGSEYYEDQGEYPVHDARASGSVDIIFQLPSKIWLMEMMKSLFLEY